MSKETNIVAFGLAEAGKTTFIAALWTVAEGGEVAGSLRAAQLGNDVKHLNNIRDTWLECLPFGRTLRGKEVVVTLHLVEPADQGTAIRLSLPDASGEVLHDFFKQRGWPSDFDQQLSQADGLLLFIHPAGLHESPYLLDLQAMVAEASEEGSRDTDHDIREVTPAAETTPTPWSADLVDTAAVLVDLLQQAVRATSAKVRPFPVSLIVSAWDLVTESSADAWMRRRAPLLHQYLTSQPELFRVRAYGVSAQGAPLEKRDSLLAVQPFERILIVGEDVAPHDITAPIRWILKA